MPLFSKSTANIAKFTGKSGWGLYNKFKFMFYFLFVMVMLMNTIVIVYQERDIEPGIKYLGGEWLGVTKQINEVSLTILDRGEILEEVGFFRSAWFFIKNFWDLIESLIILYIWLKVLSWLLMKIGLWDDSKSSVALLWALTIFFLVQVIVIIGMFPGDPWGLPFIAFFNLFKSLASIVIPSLAKVTEQLNGGNVSEIINNSIGNITA